MGLSGKSCITLLTLITLGTMVWAMQDLNHEPWSLIVVPITAINPKP